MGYSAFLIRANDIYPPCLMEGCAIPARYLFSDDESPLVEVYVCYLHQREGAEVSCNLRALARQQPPDASLD